MSDDPCQKLLGAYGAISRRPGRAGYGRRRHHDLEMLSAADPHRARRRNIPHSGCSLVRFHV